VRLGRGCSLLCLKTNRRYLSSAQNITTPPVFEHHLYIRQASHHHRPPFLPQNTQIAVCCSSHKRTLASPPTPQRGGHFISHTYRHARDPHRRPARLHARRALACALPPPAAAAHLTHLFLTPSHWSSAFHTYQTWKAPVPTKRYTSTMPFVLCGRRSRSPRSTSLSTRWRMVPR
jgi:hypothetical protein